MPQSSLFDRIVSITYVYLGPAADRFVSRQISNHLHKKPELLETGDLPELTNWIRLAMGFLTEDQTMIDDYIKRLESLDRRQQPKTKRSNTTAKKTARKPKTSLTTHADTA